jgi:hypothetical protein
LSGPALFRGDWTIDCRRRVSWHLPMSFLELVTIVVDDYDPAIRFFVDILGFDLVEDSASLTNDGRPKRWARWDSLADLATPIDAARSATTFVVALTIFGDLHVTMRPLQRGRLPRS